MEVDLLTPSMPFTPVPTTSTQRVTFDEYLDWLTEEKKADLIDGVIYMQSPPSDDDIFHSEAIPGFWLNINWLFTDEELDIVETVMTILAGNGKE